MGNAEWQKEPGFDILNHICIKTSFPEVCFYTQDDPPNK